MHAQTHNTNIRTHIYKNEYSHPKDTRENVTGITKGGLTCAIINI